MCSELYVKAANLKLHQPLWECSRKPMKDYIFTERDQNLVK